MDESLVSTLEEQLKIQRKKIADLEAERAAADARYAAMIAQEKARLDGMETVATAFGINLKIVGLGAIGQATLAQHIANSRVHVVGVSDSPNDHKSQTGETKRRRAIAPKWQKMLQSIWSFGDATLDDVVMLNPEQKRKNIGSALSYYQKQGLVSFDESTGKYSVTDSGRAACRPGTGEIVSIPTNSREPDLLTQSSVGSTDVSDLL